LEVELPESIIVTVRRPLGEHDPGECAEGFYAFDEEKRVVALVGEDGKPLPRGSTRAKDGPLWSAKVPDGQDARMVAGRLLHQKVAGEKSGSDFWRPIQYGPWSPA
jgi:hypothetical protein